MGTANAGLNSELEVDDGGGFVAVACDSMDFNPEYDEVEDTEHGSSGESNILTILRCSLTVSGSYRPGAGGGQDAGQDDVEGAFIDQVDLDVRFFPTGNNSGDKQWDFTGHVKSFTIDTTSTDKVNFSAVIQNNDGAKAVRTTIA